MEDPKLRIIKSKVKEGLNQEFSNKSDGVILFRGRLCVSHILELKRKILKEVHSSMYAMHLESTKIYQKLVKYYWWIGMKIEVVEFVSKCLVCQQVKMER